MQRVGPVRRALAQSCKGRFPARLVPCDQDDVPFHGDDGRARASLDSFRPGVADALSLPVGPVEPFLGVRPGRSAGGSDWIGLRRNEGYTVAGINQTPLLPGILVALAFLVALGSAWWREGR